MPLSPCLVYFNSHTPCGVRHVNINQPAKKNRKFQLTHPMWGATTQTSLAFSLSVFQLTHPMWGATISGQRTNRTRRISTHTPHVGCDSLVSDVSMLPDNFNSHTPCGVRQIIFSAKTGTENFNSHTPCGVRQFKSNENNSKNTFQLTHPMWGATVYHHSSFPALTISTHTPHVGCDWYVIRINTKGKISTHTPHVGCDSQETNSQQKEENFNSHTPCGVRLCQKNT